MTSNRGALLYRHFERQREIFFIRVQVVDDRKPKRETRSPRDFRASPHMYAAKPPPEPIEPAEPLVISG